MELVFSDSARKELESLPEEITDILLKHLEKMQEMPPRKHMKYGIPCHVEKVTKQARIVFNIEGDHIYILHCFGSHKECGRWYGSYR